MRKKDSTNKSCGLNKKWLIAIGILLVALLAVFVAMKIINADKAVGFKIVEDDQIPVTIEKDVIPEYRSLERALACKVEGSIYVFVSRGEKPTSGFKVDIDRMVLTEKNGKSTLLVYADFKDPQQESSVSQVVNYPWKVAKTDLKTLPDQIELRIQYEE